MIYESSHEEPSEKKSWLFMGQGTMEKVAIVKQLGNVDEDESFGGCLRCRVLVSCGWWWQNGRVGIDGEKD